MYVLCYLMTNDIHPEDSKIRISGVFEHKTEAEKWAEKIPSLYEARVYKTTYYPNTNKHKEG